jgi:hypothetical protein
MKKIIATAALGAALFAGALASTAPASAQTDDEDSFLTALDNHEIRYTDADDAIALGHGVCKQISRGEPLGQSATRSTTRQS